MTHFGWCCPEGAYLSKGELGALQVVLVMVVFPLLGQLKIQPMRFI